jgi:hypothetical protein
MEHKENGFVEQHDPKVDPAEETAPLLNGDGMPDVISFSRRFPRIIGTYLTPNYLPLYHY